MPRFDPPVKAVLFDLDGTLLDTAPDLAYALNQVLIEEGLEVLDYQTIRPMVSYGSPGLMKLAFQDTLSQAEYDRIRQNLLDIYQNNLAVKTQLFPGMEDVLSNIESLNLGWGVVTNKPRWLTQPLLQQLNLFDRAVSIVSGDDVTHQKPHPESLYLACQQADLKPEHCVYIGDAERDIAAGRHAGMRTLAACYGYIPGDQNPIHWGADGQINQPHQIMDWLPA